MDKINLPLLPDPEEATESEMGQLDTELPASEPDVIENPDGSAIVMLGDDEEEEGVRSFDENLAESLDSSVLFTIGDTLKDLIESDKESRKHRDEQYAEGIKRTGLGNEAPGGADFDGASRAVHPMLAKGCIEFASRAIKELYPASGPTKTQIIGKATDAKIAKAERKKTYINWQLMTKVKENRAETERLLSQLPLGGAQYKRWWTDQKTKRPRTETVYIDDIFLPYDQADFYSSPRVTHRQYIKRAEMESRIDSKLYRDIGLVQSSLGVQDESASRKASENVEGSHEDDTAYNDEGLREVYTVYANLEVDGDDRADGSAPYVVHLDEHTGKVLGLYRNWAEDDDEQEKKDWIVEYIFIPWRGGQGIGLGHIIGSLAASATGGIRALLDSAHIQNFPGGMKLKGGRNAGQSIQVNATEIVELDAPAGVDDIRKLVMGFPFNGPSPVLFQLLEWLTQQAESVVSVASESIANAGANMPVGTALALIEQGSINFSAIHARLHASLKKELEIVHRLNGENIEDEETIEDLGELVVTRQDFQGPMDIIPVSDPNIFSEAQRYAQLQAVMQLAATPSFTKFFKEDKLLKRALKLLQFEGVDEITNLMGEPEEMCAVEENVAVSGKEPKELKVYAEQDDVAHLETHIHYMLSPIYGSSPMMAASVLPALISHCTEHLTALYRKHATSAAQAMQEASAQTGVQMTEEEAEARGSAFADQALAKILSETIMPGMEKAMAAMKANMPKPPVDPGIALQEQTKAQLKQMQLTYDKQRDDADRLQNQANADKAATVESYGQNLDAKLAQFAASAQLINEQQQNEAKQLEQQSQHRHEELMAYLNTTLAAGQQGSPDNYSQLQQMLEQSFAENQRLAEQIKQIEADSSSKHQAVTDMLAQLMQSQSIPMAPQMPPLQPQLPDIRNRTSEPAPSAAMGNPNQPPQGMQ